MIRYLPREVAGLCASARSAEVSWGSSVLSDDPEIYGVRQHFSRNERINVRWADGSLVHLPFDL